MAGHYGKAYNSYPGQEKMEGKDDGELAYKVLMKDGDTGFTALLGGSYSTSEGFDYLDVLGCYWTSSANNDSNALGYYFYLHSRGLARLPTANCLLYYSLLRPPSISSKYSSFPSVSLKSGILVARFFNSLVTSALPKALPKAF